MTDIERDRDYRLKCIAVGVRDIALGIALLVLLGFAHCAGCDHAREQPCECLCTTGH